MNHELGQGAAELYADATAKNMSAAELWKDAAMRWRYVQFLIVGISLVSTARWLDKRYRR
jgi:hypothetical protein